MIDYIAKKIIFSNYVKGYERLNAKFVNGFIYLRLSVTFDDDREIEGWFLMDTGYYHTTLNSDLNKNSIIDEISNKIKYYSRGGVGGDTNGSLITVSKVNFGKFVLHKLITRVSNDTSGTLSDVNYMGIVGNDLLDDFDIILDHQLEQIWMKPNKNFNKNEKKLYRGISFWSLGKSWIVAGIVLDTDAYGKGIRMNDEIIQINNIPVEKIDLDTFTDKLKANDILRVRIKRGEKENDIVFKLNVFLKS